MKLKINKIGGDKIISVYWFAILFIVAAAVVYMVISFYGEPYDVRELEANILTNQIAGCLSEAGYLIVDLDQNFQDNFLGICDINFEVEDVYRWKEQQQYYVEVNILDFLSKESNFMIKAGNEDLKDFCESEGKSLPFCLDRSFYVLDRNNGNSQYQVNILSIIRKTEKNVQ